MLKITIIVILIVTITSYLIKKETYEYSHQLDLKTSIAQECLKYKYGKILLAQVPVECGWICQVIFGVGKKQTTLGVLQIRPKIWSKELIEKGIIENENDLRDHKKNIKAAHYILSSYKIKYKTIDKALYRYGGKSHKYVKKVNKELRRLNER